MPSDFDAFAEAFCVPAMQEAFGERDKYDFDLDAVVLILPDGISHVLRGAVAASRTIIPAENSAGEWIAREATSVLVARSLMEEKQIATLSASAQVIVPLHGTEAWHYDHASSDWTGSLVRLGLTRKPIAESRQLRDHGTV